ncbi:MAG: acyl-CoA dehydrogenase [Betaproteobacteria bacterium]|nr:MAG: acyl-CoA dehydrogenase [Betaproteobacteria bacterium]
MDLDDSPQEAGFRRNVRAWLRDHLTEERRLQLNAREGRAWIDFIRHWQRDLLAAGLSVRSWPRAYGGQGAPATEDLIVFEELAQADAPLDAFRVGIRIIGPMLMKLARDDQKAAFLPRIADGSDLWSQGFSEPGAGSDLAALSTRAVHRAGKYVINGQKTWNTLGHLADFCLVLARTNPEVPKHKGLTAFAVPMSSPGITVRPLQQMNGRRDFNEIFFDDVELPENAVVGIVDGGWKVAVTMLDFEHRGLAVLGFGCRRLYGRLLELARTTRIGSSNRAALGELDIRRRLAALGGQARIAVLNNHRFLAMIPEGGVPGPEAAIQKLHSTELNKAMHALALEIASLADLADSEARERLSAWEEDYLTSFGMTIAGGTSQIQRNIIAERALGLPR